MLANVDIEFYFQDALQDVSLSYGLVKIILCQTKITKVISDEQVRSLIDLKR